MFKLGIYTRRSKENKHNLRKLIQKRALSDGKHQSGILGELRQLALRRHFVPQELIGEHGVPD